jgi:hypothetical protein
MLQQIGEGGCRIAKNHGLDWVDEELGGNDRLFGLAYGAETWVLVGDSPILPSSNGTNWQRLRTLEF